ncbi:hypothetical protein BC830DRAFT_1230457 [Chytriomyces sp. MP71]|nr:hypothetical protein BC830DRAFT_1230457 [Chytriomyces sp. MP71]
MPLMTPASDRENDSHLPAENPPAFVAVSLKDSRKWLEKLSNDMRQIVTSDPLLSKLAIEFTQQGIYAGFPVGYRLYSRMREIGTHADKYLYGHPSGRKFRSTSDFLPHLLYLTKRVINPTTICECICCQPKLSSGPRNSLVKSVSPSPTVYSQQQNIVVAPVAPELKQEVSTISMLTAPPKRSNREALLARFKKAAERTSLPAPRLSDATAAYSHSPAPASSSQTPWTFLGVGRSQSREPSVQSEVSLWSSVGSAGIRRIAASTDTREASVHSSLSHSVGTPHCAASPLSHEVVLSGLSIGAADREASEAPFAREINGDDLNVSTAPPASYFQHLGMSHSWQDSVRSTNGLSMAGPDDKSASQSFGHGLAIINEHSFSGVSTFDTFVPPNLPHSLEAVVAQRMEESLSREGSIESDFSAEDDAVASGALDAIAQQTLMEEYPPIEYSQINAKEVDSFGCYLDDEISDFSSVGSPIRPLAEMHTNDQMTVEEKFVADEVRSDVVEQDLVARDADTVTVLTLMQAGGDASLEPIVGDTLASLDSETLNELPMMQNVIGEQPLEQQTLYMNAGEFKAEKHLALGELHPFKSGSVDTQGLPHYVANLPPPAPGFGVAPPASAHKIHNTSRALQEAVVTPSTTYLTANVDDSSESEEDIPLLVSKRQRLKVSSTPVGSPSLLKDLKKKLQTVRIPMEPMSQPSNHSSLMTAGSTLVADSQIKSAAPNLSTSKLPDNKGLVSQIFPELVHLDSQQSLKVPKLSESVVPKTFHQKPLARKKPSSVRIQMAPVPTDAILPGLTQSSVSMQASNYAGVQIQAQKCNLSPVMAESLSEPSTKSLVTPQHGEFQAKKKSKSNESVPVVQANIGFETNQNNISLAKASTHTLSMQSDVTISLEQHQKAGSESAQQTAFNPKLVTRIVAIIIQQSSSLQLPLTHQRISEMVAKENPNAKIPVNYVDAVNAALAFQLSVQKKRRNSQGATPEKMCLVCARTSATQWHQTESGFICDLPTCRKKVHKAKLQPLPPKFLERKSQEAVSGAPKVKTVPKIAITEKSSKAFYRQTSHITIKEKQHFTEIAVSIDPSGTFRQATEQMDNMSPSIKRTIADKGSMLPEISTPETGALQKKVKKLADYLPDFKADSAQSVQEETGTCVPIDLMSSSVATAANADQNEAFIIPEAHSNSSSPALSRTYTNTSLSAVLLNLPSSCTDGFQTTGDYQATSSPPLTVDKRRSAVSIEDELAEESGTGVTIASTIVKPASFLTPQLVHQQTAALASDDEDMPPFQGIKDALAMLKRVTADQVNEVQKRIPSNNMLQEPFRVGDKVWVSVVMYPDTENYRLVVKIKDRMVPDVEMDMKEVVNCKTFWPARITAIQPASIVLKEKENLANEVWEEPIVLDDLGDKAVGLSQFADSDYGLGKVAVDALLCKLELAEFEGFAVSMEARFVRKWDAVMKFKQFLLNPSLKEGDWNSTVELSVPDGKGMPSYLFEKYLKALNCE